MCQAVTAVCAVYLCRQQNRTAKQELHTTNLHLQDRFQQSELHAYLVKFRPSCYRQIRYKVITLADL